METNIEINKQNCRATQDLLDRQIRPIIKKYIKSLNGKFRDYVSDLYLEKHLLAEFETHLNPVAVIGGEAPDLKDILFVADGAMNVVIGILNQCKEIENWDNVAWEFSQLFTQTEIAYK